MVGRQIDVSLRAWSAAAFLLLAPPVRAAGLDCARAPKKALPALVDRFMKSGEKLVVHGVIARVCGGTAMPVLSSTFSEGETLHFFYVLVVPGDSPDELKPQALLFVTLVDSGGRRERWIIKTDLSGKLSAAAQVLDALDEKGNLVSGEEEYNPRSGNDPETARRLDRELKFLCRVQADGTLSKEETDAAPKRSPP